MFFHERNCDIWRWGAAAKQLLRSRGAGWVMRAPPPFVCQAKQAVFDPLRKVDSADLPALTGKRLEVLTEIPVFERRF